MVLAALLNLRHTLACVSYVNKWCVSSATHGLQDSPVLGGEVADGFDIKLHDGEIPSVYAKSPGDMSRTAGTTQSREATVARKLHVRVWG
jgi:hypothetical protein